MKYIHSLYIGLLSLLFVGCQEEQLNNMQTGGFQISLQDVAADITTKTLPENLEDPVVSNFQLKITNEVSGTSIYNGAYTSNLIPASTGVYSITATHGDNPPLAKDNPYYKGDTTGVELKEDQVASVELKCRVANALASVVYTSEAMFKEVFTDYGVKVGIGKLTVDLENGTTESAYYQAGSIPTFTFVGTLKGNGKEVTKVLEDTKLSDPSTFAAGQHCKITLSLSTTTAGVNLDIEKVEAIPVTITATIPMEWLPAPKVSATGFDENKTLTIYETVAPDAASIDFEVAQPLQDLSFTLNFEDEQFTSLNKDYQLSTMTDEEKIALSDAGITLPLIGSNEPKIAFSQAFNARLLSKNDRVVNNTITINSVQANNRENKDEAPLTYIIAVHKPEFSVSVLPGNIWTKEFTAEEIVVEDGKGNAEIIRQRLVYQYLEDGVWENFNDNRRQYFVSHPNTKSYTVRAIYRDEIESTSTVNVILETPTQVANSKMEEWYTTKDDTGLWGYTYYHFFPCLQGNSDIWWATNNDRSQDGTKAGRFSYRGCFNPCVSYSESVKYEGNRSALIYTSGHGGGYANTSTVLYPEGAIAGHLFIGQYSWRDKTETVTPGHSFNARPTHMKFYYKYIPKNTDEFKAYIELKNGNEVIADGEFIPSPISSETNWDEATIELNYVSDPKVATSIFIQFLSTTKTSFSRDDFDINANISFPNMNDWVGHIGSKLYIDDISLIYEK